MSELQEAGELESNVNDVIETQELEPNKAAELAPASGAEHEEGQQEAPVDNDKVQKVINKKHWEAKENERKYEDERRQREELELKLRELQAPQEPIVPAMPDQFDDDYENRMREREQAIADRARWEEQKAITQHQSQQAENQRMLDEQRQLQDKVKSYTDRAQEFGISQQELAQLGQQVGSYGISDDLTKELLSDPQGPLLVKHFASSPTDLDAVSKMSPFQAANYINENVRPKAQGLKPKTTNTPAPAQQLKAGSADPELGRHKLIGGATFE